jgi:hypothetical protein
MCLRGWKTMAEEYVVEDQVETEADRRNQTFFDAVEYTTS